MSKEDKKAIAILIAMAFGVVTVMAWLITGHWWGVMLWALAVLLWLAPLGPGIAAACEEAETARLRDKLARQEAYIRELESRAG